jgi:uncharacterized membrane protein YcaP (DUF421 family)
MSSQLSRNELLAVISLAAAIGPAVESPDQGLLPAAIIAIVVVALQRVLTLGTFSSHRFETWFDGAVSKLVTDGKIDLRELGRCSLSLERLRATLRSEGLHQFGQVALVLFEAGGAFTVVRRDREIPGLSLVPEWDRALRATQQVDATHSACVACGATSVTPQVTRCAECGKSAGFQPAVCGRSPKSVQSES